MPTIIDDSGREYPFVLTGGVLYQWEKQIGASLGGCAANQNIGPFLSFEAGLAALSIVSKTDRGALRARFDTPQAWRSLMTAIANELTRWVQAVSEDRPTGETSGDSPPLPESAQAGETSTTPKS